MVDLPPILDWIDGQGARMRDRVIEWSNINSGSYHIAGLEAVRRMLRQSWGPLGGAVEEIALPDERTIDSAGRVALAPLGKALRIRKRPGAPWQVFFCIHMDTVYPADSPFQTCTMLDANTVNGPGVADAKGGLAIMQVVVEAIERSALADRVGWEVLMNPDEEIGSPGSSFLFEEAARRNHIGLLFEPAFGERDLVSARSGSASFAVVVRGRSAHAGRDPGSGRNAIHAMAGMVVALVGLASEHVTINVGKVEGGGPVNVVPDLAICRFNVRVKTPQEQARVTGQIERIVTGANGLDGITAELSGGFHRPPKPLDDHTRKLLDLAIDCAKHLGLSVGHQRSGGVSDGNQLAAAGLPNLDSLGPRGGRIHSAQEFLLLDSLAERAKLTVSLLAAWVGSGICAAGGV